jgi:Ras-related protein Rab-11B
VVYDITSRASFEAVGSWIHDVRERADESVAIGLIANKIDLSTRAITRRDG